MSNKIFPMPEVSGCTWKVPDEKDQLTLHGEHCPKAAILLTKDYKPKSEKKTKYFPLDEYNKTGQACGVLQRFPYNCGLATVTELRDYGLSDQELDGFVKGIEVMAVNGWWAGVVATLNGGKNGHQCGRMAEALLRSGWQPLFSVPNLRYIKGTQANLTMYYKDLTPVWKELGQVTHNGQSPF